jgi:probable rRNA maturation factor
MRIVTAGSPRLRGRAELERIAGMLRAIGAGLRPRGRTVTVVLVGERRMALLNRRYKGRAGAAEILTFPCGDAPGPRMETPLGEICLCWASLGRGAQRRRVSRRAYAARLVVHGLLHLAGRSHATSAAERRMEAAERRLLHGRLAASEIERLFA